MELQNGNFLIFNFILNDGNMRIYYIKVKIREKTCNHSDQFTI